MLIEYDGGPFCGWQRQRGQATVQETLEAALAVVFRCATPVIGAGRTDSGVHARGQVAHFSVPEALDIRRVRHSVNGLTPRSVVVRALEVVPDHFHARFDATSRRYHYYVSCQPTALARHFRYLLPHAVDFAAMNRAAAHLVGTRHFGAFCLRRAATRNRVCTITRAMWAREAPSYHWRFEVEADRFLHGMVRALVGTLLEVGRSRLREQDLLRILESRDRRQAGPAVPPHGLILERVHYQSKS